MPEKETIFEKIRSLPTIDSIVISGRVPNDGEIWEENEGEAHFKMTKEKMPYQQLPTVYSLSVSGKRQSVKKIIDDFTQALGKPLIREAYPKYSGIEFLLWGVPENLN